VEELSDDRDDRYDGRTDPKKANARHQRLNGPTHDALGASAIRCESHPAADAVFGWSWSKAETAASTIEPDISSERV
jgi:hypothetical protein